MFKKLKKFIKKLGLSKSSKKVQKTTATIFEKIDTSNTNEKSKESLNLFLNELK